MNSHYVFRLLICLLFLAVVLAIGLFVARHRRTARRNNRKFQTFFSRGGVLSGKTGSSSANQPPVAAPICPEAKPSTISTSDLPSPTKSGEKEPSNVPSSQLDFKAETITSHPDFAECSPDIQDFLRDRLEEMQLANGSTDGDTSSFCLAAADLLDELLVMESSYTEGDRCFMDFVRKVLASSLASVHAEFLRDDTWNPSRQRAVKVTHSNEVDAYRILKTRTTGVIQNGKVLRKQEVEVIAPTKK